MICKPTSRLVKFVQWRRRLISGPSLCLRRRSAAKAEGPYRNAYGDRTRSRRFGAAHCAARTPGQRTDARLPRPDRGTRHRRRPLGPGDLIRPHQPDRSVPKLPIDSSWQVIESVRLAVLDLEFAKRSAPFPEVSAMLTGRLIERSHSLATQMAIVQSRRVSERLLKLLWYQANRWGTIGAWGAAIKLRCTHSILAELVAATRPSVTLALRRLESARLLSHEGDMWFLHQPPRPPPISLA